MNLSSTIDTICVYVNSVASFLATLQRLKNEFHTQTIDYPALVLRLISSPRTDPASLGELVDLRSRDQTGSSRENILLAALVSLAVYHPPPPSAQGQGTDWTTDLTPILNSLAPPLSPRPKGNGKKRRLQEKRQAAGEASGWGSGQLAPVMIDLKESHYMTSTKAFVFLACRGDSVVLSLPGTNSRADWLSNLHSSTTDFDILPVEAQTCNKRARTHRHSDQKTRIKVHAGFKYIATTLLTHAGIRRYLSTALSSGIDKMLLCGHSQAGAVVSLLSLLLRQDAEFANFTDIEVVTFGSAACIVQGGADLGIPCTSFIRCLGRDVGDNQTTTWMVDPVPILTDSLLSVAPTDSSGAMTPMGVLLTLIDRPDKSETRQLDRHDLQDLATPALLNLSAAPHAMKGYVRCLLRALAVDDLVLAIDTLDAFGEDDDEHATISADDDDDDHARAQLVTRERDL